MKRPSPRKKPARSRLPQAVILTSGADARLAPWTRAPALLPVLNRPVLAHVLERLSGLVSEVLVVTGAGERERFEAALGRMRGALAPRYVEADAGGSVASRLLQAAPLLRGDFLCLDGATLLAREDLKALTEPGTALEYPQPLTGAPRPWACRLDARALPVLERLAASGEHEPELPAALRAVEAELPLRGIPARTAGFRVTYAWDLLTLHEELVRHLPKPAVRGRVEKGVTLKGDVHIGRGSVIKSGTYIDGPVVIGEDCEVGPHAYLRHGAVLGDRCKVGHAAEVKNSILFEDSEVESFCLVLDSILGSRASFGAGCMTANLRLDKARIALEVGGTLVDTGRTKLGTLVGDGARLTLSNAVLEGLRIAPEARVPPSFFVQRDVS